MGEEERAASPPQTRTATHRRREKQERDRIERRQTRALVRHVRARPQGASTTGTAARTAATTTTTDSTANSKAKSAVVTATTDAAADEATAGAAVSWRDFFGSYERRSGRRRAHPDAAGRTWKCGSSGGQCCSDLFLRRYFGGGDADERR